MKKLLYIFLLSITLSACNHPEFFQATNATLDLRHWDSSRRAFLGGDWRAIDNLEPRWINSPLPENARIFPMGTSWSELVGSRYGCATYELNLHLPSTPQNYEIFLPSAGSAYQLLIDGESVLDAGKVACSREEIEPNFGRKYAEITLSGEVRITLRVSDYYHEPGGPVISPQIGGVKQMLLWRSKHDFISMLSIGGMLFIGIYHLVVWLLRREDMAGFWFSILCAIIAIRIPSMEMILQRATRIEHYPLAVHFSYLTFYAGFSITAWYLDASSYASWFRKAAIVTSIFSLIAGITLLFPHPEIYNPILPYYQFFVLIIGSLMLVRTSQILREDDVGSRFLTIPIILFVFAAIHDISHNRGGPGIGVDLIPYVLLILMLSQSVAIAQRFALAFHTTDHLSKNLQNEVDKQTNELKSRLVRRRALRTRLSESNQILSLIHEELKVALVQAHAAAEAKTSFLANMSHELRTPLNGVIGMSEMLYISALNADQRSLIATLQASSDALLVIISDILDFSKIDTGEVELETVYFRLSDVVENVLHLLAPKAEAQSLQVGAIFEKNVPSHFFGDPGRVAQILTNLIGNALKFTNDGEVITSISVAKQRKNQIILRFDVADTGVGIPEEVQARLFEAFEQASLSTTRKYGGTGLGLAITRDLIHKLDGKLGVHSIVGKGSTFWFELPFVPAEPGETSAMVKELAGIQALIVDDNETNIRVLEGLLWRWNVKTIAVTSAEEALSVIKTGHKIDIALFDYQMPHVDGLTLAERLKKDPLTAELPIVLLTSISLRSCSLRAKEIGVNIRVTKPIRRKVLAAAMCKALALGSDENLKIDSEHGSYPLQIGRILVVDDNKINRKVISRMLRGFGYTVQTAVDGEKALAILEENGFDAILMDCQMPVLDGYETTKRIRANETDHQTPIIAVTAAGTKKDRSRALASGMNDWIFKPVRRHTLFEVLQNWIVDDGDVDNAVLFAGSNHLPTEDESQEDPEQ